MDVETAPKDAMEVARLASENERLYEEIDKLREEKRRKEEDARARQEHKDREAMRIVASGVIGFFLSGVVAEFKPFGGIEAAVTSFLAMSFLVWAVSHLIKP